MFKINRMVSVKIGSGGNAIGVTGPQGTGGIGSREAERISMFSEAVYVSIRWQISFEPEVLWLKNDRM
jgi:hypothetical protein